MILSNYSVKNCSTLQFKESTLVGCSFKMLHSCRFWPCSQILNQVRKDRQGQTLQLIRNNYKLCPKKFYAFSLRSRQIMFSKQYIKKQQKSFIGFSTRGLHYITFYDRNLCMDFRNKLECLSFQVLHSRVGFWPQPKTLDQAGKTCKGQSFQLIAKICKLRP